MVRDWQPSLDCSWRNSVVESEEPLTLLRGDCPRFLVKSLSEQVNSLTKRLQKPNPRNSSLPAGSEHPHGKPPRKPSKRRIRKQGVQEGHNRHLRELVPIEQCDAVVSRVLESGLRFGGLVRPDESQAIGHQVWETPPIEPTVIE